MTKYILYKYINIFLLWVYFDIIRDKPKAELLSWVTQLVKHLTNKKKVAVWSQSKRTYHAATFYQSLSYNNGDAWFFCFRQTVWTSSMLSSSTANKKTASSYKTSTVAREPMWTMSESRMRPFDWLPGTSYGSAMVAHRMNST